MKPFDQRMLVERDGEGDCWRATIASILERDDVPHFKGEDSMEQMRATNEWLASLGLKLRFVREWEPRTEDHPQRFVIASGLSPRGVNHAVVGDLSKPLFEVRDDGASEYFKKEVMRNAMHLAHDPHPSRAGIRWFDCAIEIVPIEEAA